MKTFVKRAVAYLIVTFPLAYVWHLVAFKDVYDELGIFNREEPIVALGFIVIVIQGLLLSYIFPLLYEEASAIKSGLKFGALMGLFLWSSQVVAAAAKHEVTSLGTWLGIESAYFAVQFALVGLAFGLVHRRSVREVQSDGL